MSFWVLLLLSVVPGAWAVLANCSDGIQNQGEFGIDCGFPCPMQCRSIYNFPFDNCNDGVVYANGSSWVSAMPDQYVSGPYPATAFPVTSPPRYGFYSNYGSFDGAVQLGSFRLSGTFTMRLGMYFTLAAHYINCGSAFAINTCTDDYANGYMFLAAQGQTQLIHGTAARGNGFYTELFITLSGTSLQIYSLSDGFVGVNNDGFGLGAPLNATNVTCTLGPSQTLALDAYSVNVFTVYNDIVLTTPQMQAMYDNGSFAFYQKNCFDGIQNYAEKGVDCGGPSCVACPYITSNNITTNNTLFGCNRTAYVASDVYVPGNCSDGLKNQGEIGTDCGYPCNASCPTIFDATFDNLNASGTGNSTLLGTVAWYPNDYSYNRDPVDTAAFRDHQYGFACGTFDVPLPAIDFGKNTTLRYGATFNQFDIQGVNDGGPILVCPGNGPSILIQSVNACALFFVRVNGINYIFDADTIVLLDPVAAPQPFNFSTTLQCGKFANGLFSYAVNQYMDMFFQFVPTGNTTVVTARLLSNATGGITNFSFSVTIPQVLTPVSNCTFHSNRCLGRATVYPNVTLTEAQMQAMQDVGAVPNTANCFDGIKNYNETRVDCGGVCRPCNAVVNTTTVANITNTTSVANTTNTTSVANTTTVSNTTTVMNTTTIANTTNTTTIANTTTITNATVTNTTNTTASNTTTVVNTTTVTNGTTPVNTTTVVNTTVIANVTATTNTTATIAASTSSLLEKILTTLAKPIVYGPIAAGSALLLCCAACCCVMKRKASPYARLRPRKIKRQQG